MLNFFKEKNYTIDIIAYVYVYASRVDVVGRMWDVEPLERLRERRTVGAGLGGLGFGFLL